MLSKVTHGTSSDSIILVATVVLPDALPPHMPATNKDYRQCLLTLCSLRICSSCLTVNMLCLHYKDQTILFKEIISAYCDKHTYNVVQSFYMLHQIIFIVTKCFK